MALSTGFPRHIHLRRQRSAGKLEEDWGGAKRNDSVTPGTSRSSVEEYLEELDAMTDNQPMTAEQAETLKQLAEAAYELDAFKPNLTRAEADLRIATLTAKLKLLDGPPHTL